MVSTKLRLFSPFEAARSSLTDARTLATESLLPLKIHCSSNQPSSTIVSVAERTS